jgi:hypothetical protein
MNSPLTRLRHLPEVGHARAGHACEVIDDASVHLQQLADYLLDIPARAEASTLPSEHQDANLIASCLQLGGQVPNVGVDLEGQGIEPLGS